MYIERGQGFKFRTKSGKFGYGLVVNVNDESFNYVLVRSIVDTNALGDTIFHRCYDDSDAVYSRDKDNVRLTSCPPPFSVYGNRVNYKGEPISNSYAVADMDRMRKLSFDDFSRYGCQIIDGGVKVSARDLYEVECHPWASRNQRERVRFDISELNLDDDEHSYGLSF